MSLDVTLSDEDGEELFSANITHNLGKMAKAARIYNHLWRPESIGIMYARQLIDPLQSGLERMKLSPDYYREYDSPNGWGLFKHFVPWIEDYLAACLKYPHSKISVCR